MYGVYSTVSAKPIYCMHNFCFSAMSHTRMHMQTRQRGWRFEYLEGKSEQGLGHNTHTRGGGGFEYLELGTRTGWNKGAQMVTL